MRPVSRKPIGRWKELKWKDCQILLNLSDLLRVEERQWEECICEDLGPASISFCLSALFLSVPSCLPVCLSCCLPVSARIGWSASPSLYVCQSVRLSVCCPDLSPSVSEFAAMPPTPQPTDDVDIYFETPADDKEHSRFQRAKEQLEIRHRNRMERVSLPARIRTLIPERQYVRIFPLSCTVWPHCTWSQMLWRDLFQ